MLVAFTCSNLSTVWQLLPGQLHQMEESSFVLTTITKPPQARGKPWHSACYSRGHRNQIASRHPSIQGPSRKTDFNDLAMAEGLEVVRSRLNAAAPLLPPH